jgi:Fe2+ transport system protein FeoA
MGCGESEVAHCGAMGKHLFSFTASRASDHGNLRRAKISLFRYCKSISISYLSAVPTPQTIAQTLQQDSLISLEQAKVGCEFHIRFLNGPACERLRQMGFCESMRVKKITDGRNMLCTVCGTKMALSRELAHQIIGQATA